MATMVLWGIASCCTCTQAQKVGQETGLLVGWAGDLHATLRANPATSAPSHICETWRNVAQTCLIIKEMGPERSRINVSDPI